MNTKLLYPFVCFLILILNAACSEINLKDKSPTIRPVTVKVMSYCPENGRSLVNVYGVNLSTQTAEDQILFDTDRDGLADNFELDATYQQEYNISQAAPDTNGDGYSDLVTYSIGYKVDTQQNLSACVQPDLDTDRDGLSDCEEAILGTDYRNPDTDFDGIPDGLELRFGLNPRVHDSELDPDGDGYSNLEEIKNNSMVYVSHVTQKLQHSINYKVEAFINEDNENCYQVEVSNIPLVNVSNGNMIRLMFLERETVIGQGQVNFSRDVTITASRNFPDGHIFEVDEVQNQTLLIVP